jgi:hypothetical protein
LPVAGLALVSAKMSVLSRLRAFRAAAVRDELRLAGTEVPDRYLANFVNYEGAAEQVHVIASLVACSSSVRSEVVTSGAYARAATRSLE